MGEETYSCTHSQPRHYIVSGASELHGSHAVLRRLFLIRLGGLQRLSKRLREDKNPLAMQEIQP